MGQATILIMGIEIETNELLVAVRCGDISRADLVAAVGGHRAPRAGRFRVPVYQGRGLGTARSDFPAHSPTGIDRRRSTVRNEALTFEQPAERKRVEGLAKLAEWKQRKAEEQAEIESVKAEARAVRKLAA